VFFELNFQASNVIALRHGVVAAHAENVYTIAAMRKAGVEVLALKGLIWRCGTGDLIA
jgi:arginine deiminase